jgi:hypothetical protein
MIGGWLIGLSVYGFSYLYAQRLVQAASERAQTLWNKPKEVDPASLPEEDRLALLALITVKQRPQLVVPTDSELRRIKPGPLEPPVKINPKDFVPDAGTRAPLHDRDFLPDEGRTDLVGQFLRISKDRAAASGARLVGGAFNLPIASNDKGDFIYYDDASKAWKPADFDVKRWVPIAYGWRWVVLCESAHTWSDEPGDDWWFVDPATGEETDRELTDIQAEKESRGITIGVALALLLSAPWLWYFLLARLREISDAVRAHTRD